MRNTNFKKYAGLFRQLPNVANRIRLRRATSNAHVFDKTSYAEIFRHSAKILALGEYAKHKFQKIRRLIEVVTTRRS